MRIHALTSAFVRVQAIERCPEEGRPERVWRFSPLRRGEPLWARLYDDVDDLRQAVTAFVKTYNNEWLIQRHGHQTPREKYLASLSSEAA